jgi:hypothetical protein
MMRFNGGLAKRQLALILALTAAACGRDSATGPASSDGALRFEAVSATQLEGTVDEPVIPVPTVRVTTSTGRPVPGIIVTFIPVFGPEFEQFDGSVTRSTVITDSLGVASPGDWILGPMPGPHSLEAFILDAHLGLGRAGPGRVVAFYVQAKPRAMESLLIEAATPTQLRGTVGDLVDPVAAVIVKTPLGKAGALPPRI